MADDVVDVLIIGAGLGGISLALRLAESDLRVGLVAKKPLDECSSHWAQGGIAAAVGPDDSPEQHAADTDGAVADDTVSLCRFVHHLHTSKAEWRYCVQVDSNPQIAGILAS